MPPTIETTQCSCVRNIKMFTHISQASSVAANRNHSEPTSVSGLLLTRGPSHIAGLVSFFVILTIKACAKWARSNISAKTFERVPPLWAHSNATPTIVGVCFLSLVFTSVYDVLPDSVKRGNAAHKCMAVGDKCRFHPIPFKASTGLSIPTSQARVWNRYGFSARTSADALALRLATWKDALRTIRNDLQPSKCFTDNRNCGRHNDGGSSVVFSDGRWFAPTLVATLNSKAVFSI